MQTTITLDGVQTDFQFDWPYLERSHLMVTVNMAARAFTFINDHTIRVRDLFGNPLPAGQTLKIFRVTPDLVAYANIVDTANLTADDLNRLRLQLLFLIQERSGGLGGSVAHVVQLLANEIETLSGALDTLGNSQAILTSGLQTLDSLGGKVTALENGAAALDQLVQDTLAELGETEASLVQRVDDVVVRQGNLESSVSSQIAVLSAADVALASRTDQLEAKVDAIAPGEGDDDEEQDTLSAAIINAAVAEARSSYAQAKRIDTLEAKVNDDISALIQVEQTARVEADLALAEQITTLQSQIGDDIAQVIQDLETKVETVGGKVTNIEANATLKVAAQRADGRYVAAGIGLNATASDDYTGSEIVFMANRMVFVDSAADNAPLRPLFTAGNVDGSPTFVIPSNVMGDRLYPGRLLVDGSIEARSIKANEITGDKLKAGAITTREIDVGLGTNLMQNTEFADNNGTDASNWWWGGTTWGGSWGTQRGVDQSGWTLAGGHTLYHWHAYTNGDLNIDSAYSALDSPWMPATAGTRYEFSVYSGAHRCKVQVQLAFGDAAGNWLYLSPVAATLVNNAEAPGGTTLAGYKRIGGLVTAPAGTTQMRLWIRKGAHASYETSSYAFITRPMVAEAMPNQTRLSPYTLGGLGTKITPGGITTPSLSALSANIGLLRTAASGARTEIESNQIRVYDGNGVMRVRMGLW
jgi:hypothetical protein